MGDADFFSNYQDPFQDPTSEWVNLHFDPDDNYMPMILPFSCYLNLNFNRNDPYLAVFDDFIIRLDGTISLWIDFVEEPFTGIGPRRVVIKTSFPHYIAVLDFLTNPDPNNLELPGVYNFYNSD